MLFTLWELANATNQGFWGEKKAILTFRVYFRHLWERQCTHHHHLIADVEIKTSGGLFESHRKWLNRSSIPSLLFPSPHIIFPFCTIYFSFHMRTESKPLVISCSPLSLLSRTFHYVWDTSNSLLLSEPYMPISSRVITPLLPTIQVYREKEVKNGQVSALKYCAVKILLSIFY